MRARSAPLRQLRSRSGSTAAWLVLALAAASTAAGSLAHGTIGRPDALASSTAWGIVCIIGLALVGSLGRRHPAAAAAACTPCAVGIALLLPLPWASLSAAAAIAAATLPASSRGGAPWRRMAPVAIATVGLAAGSAATSLAQLHALGDGASAGQRLAAALLTGIAVALVAQAGRTLAASWHASGPAAHGRVAATATTSTTGMLPAAAQVCADLAITALVVAGSLAVERSGGVTVALAATGALAGGAHGLLRELLDRHARALLRLRETVGRYVPSHVVASVLERQLDPSGVEAVAGAASSAHADPALAAEQRDVTVLFVDIRGFSTWSERTPPSEVVAELNRLLDGLVTAVLASGGTLDKFTGDGFMAFWNAPTDQHDHAARAVRALPPMLMRLDELNLRRDAERAQRLGIGIGIASGATVVGTVGHAERLSYTAIGDTVNLAARLEGATREQGVPVLIDESTFLALPIQMQRQMTRLPSFPVKGRAELARAYAPTALIDRAGRVA